MNVGSLLSWLVPHLGESTSGKGSQPKKEINMRNRIKPSQRPGRSQSEFKVQEFNNPDLGSNPEAIIAMTKDFIAGQFPTNTEISLMATFIWLDGNVKILQPTALGDPDAVHNYLKKVAITQNKHGSPIAVLVCSEVWTSTNMLPEFAKHFRGSLEDLPGTTEAVLLNYESADCHEVWMAPINTVLGQRNLGEWDKMKDYKATRFGGYIARCPRSQGPGAH